MYSQMINRLIGITLRQLGSAAVCWVLILAISASASAQAVRTDAPGCATIVERLQPGTAPASLIRALRDVGECPERGPVGLARIWEAPPSDTAALNALSSATLSTRDSRVVPAVVKTLEDSGMPRPIRLAALGTLVGLYSPDQLVDFKQRPGEEASGPIYVLMGGWSHPMGHDGASPVTPADRDRLLAVLTRISQSDTDQGIRYAALQVLARLGVGTR